MPKLCLECSADISLRAPQARYCNPLCTERARDKRDRPQRRKARRDAFRANPQPNRDRVVAWQDANPERYEARQVAHRDERSADYHGTSEGTPMQRHQNARALGFRSGLEEVIASALKAAGVDPGYESLRIPYIPEKVKHYTADFVLPNGVVIETKGWFVSEDRSKHLLVKKQHPDLDIRFVFARPTQRISKQSNTTYAQWANTKGFKWADKTIPQAWLDEPANMKSLIYIAVLKAEAQEKEKAKKK